MDRDFNAPVVIEVPDERLAEVEKAKMSGEALVSVGSKGTQVGARHIVAKAAQDAMDIGTSTENRMPDYLTDLESSVENNMELNLKKAQAHAEVSAELVRQQQEAVKARRQEGGDSFEEAKKNNELNRALAEEYSKNMAEWERARMKAEGVFNKELRLISEEEAFSGEPMTELGKRAKNIKAVPVEREVFETKDAIIYGATGFEEQAKTKLEPVKEAEAQVEYSNETPKAEVPSASSKKAASTKAADKDDSKVEAPKEG